MSEGERPESELAYGIDERPATAWESLLFGWQHTLVDISPFILPLAVAGALGLSAGDSASFLNFVLLSMGVATLVQTTFGNRLPVVQGPSATLIAALVPVASQLGAAAMWGAVAFGAAVEAVVGASGLVGRLRRAFPPLVTGVVIVAIGLSLATVAGRFLLQDDRPAAVGLGVLTLASVLVLQRLGDRLHLPLLARASVFLSIWVLGLVAGGALGLVDWELVASTPWLALPRLLPFGGPFVGGEGVAWVLVPAAVLAILAGYVASMVESIGDYAATCTVAGVRLTERHVTRGIGAEGVGCLLAAVLGGLPCTSYTQNVGIIATTRVASRFVVQVAALILVLYGLVPKFGALLVALPRPVLGGVFLYVCALIVASGLRLIGTQPSSEARAVVVGLPLVAAIGVPAVVRSGPVWAERLHPAVLLLLGNSMVLAVFLAILLSLLLDRPDGP